MTFDKNPSCYILLFMEYQVTVIWGQKQTETSPSTGSLSSSLWEILRPEGINVVPPEFSGSDPGSPHRGTCLETSNGKSLETSGLTPYDADDVASHAKHDFTEKRKLFSSTVMFSTSRPISNYLKVRNMESFSFWISSFLTTTGRRKSSIDSDEAPILRTSSHSALPSLKPRYSSSSACGRHGSPTKVLQQVSWCSCLSSV